VSLLENVPEEHMMEVLPAKPKAGEVYLYKYEQDLKKLAITNFLFTTGSLIFYHMIGTVINTSG